MEKRKEKILDGKALYLEVRDKKDPLKGLSLEEKCVLAKLYIRTEWPSYGKLTAYVREHGALPPLKLEEGKKPRKAGGRGK